MAKKAQKVRYTWNSNVYSNRVYTDPDGNDYSLALFVNQTYNYNYRYRDNNGKSKKGDIDIEVRYDPHCFTHERKNGEICPALSFDEFDNGSTIDRVFDLERYNNGAQLVHTIKHLSKKNCKETRTSGKALYFKQRNKQKPNDGLYIIIKVKNQSGKLVMFVETAHYRNNEPFKLDLSSKEETYSIILGRLISNEWPELLIE